LLTPKSPFGLSPDGLFGVFVQQSSGNVPAL
jgi:hypothetical protein